MTTETMLKELRRLMTTETHKVSDEEYRSYIRDHGPALLAMVEDAERWRRFELNAEIVTKANGVYLEAQVMYGRMGDKPRNYIDALIAIDQARAEGWK